MCFLWYKNKECSKFQNQILIFKISVNFEFSKTRCALEYARTQKYFFFFWVLGSKILNLDLVKRASRKSKKNAKSLQANAWAEWCGGKPEWRGGAWAQFSRNAAFFYALFTHFLPKKNVKEQLLHSINKRNNLLRFFRPDSITNMPV